MYDVAIIGGGVCGCSLLYALSGYRLRVVLLEKTNDVGMGATKANSAIVHAGYDPEPGTRMAVYNVEGNRLIRQLAARLDIPFKDTGSLVLAFGGADRAMVDKLLERGKKNGVPGLRVVRQAELRQMEPGVAPKAVCALYAPTGAVVSPWELAFAQAETAVKNGAEVRLDAAVAAVEKKDGWFVLHAPGGAARARFVVNCAGVAAADVAALAGPAGFAIRPSRGQYFILDKSEGHKVRQVLFQCPTKDGKGVLIAPTVHGNLIAGPNAEAADDVSTTAEGLAFVKRMALRSAPGVDFRQSIRCFAGLRAAADTGDFIVGESPAVPGFFNVAGIQSPGLTAAPAIARSVVGMLAAAGLALEEKPGCGAGRTVLRFGRLSPEEKARAIAQNPLYGRVVCRCETVTEGELTDALRGPLPPRSLDAAKRRCNPGMGRCQGGFCGPRVQAVIARELGLNRADVPLDRAGMTIVTGRTKGGAAAYEAEARPGPPGGPAAAEHASAGEGNESHG